MKDINYIVYKTTNLINNKIYIGVHKQLGKDFDGYFGSGKSINKALIKYGANNFKRETLFSYIDEKDAYSKECEIVDSYFLSKDNTYNIKVGGIGGGEGNPENLNSEKSKLSKIEKYGSVTGMINNPEIQAKAKATCTLKYGNPWGAAHNRESKLKELESKVRDAHRKYPELHKVCELVLHDTIEFTGTMYELLVYMYGVRSAVTYRTRLINKLDNTLSFNKRSKWNNYKVRYKLT